MAGEKFPKFSLFSVYSMLSLLGCQTQRNLPSPHMCSFLQEILGLT